MDCKYPNRNKNMRNAALKSCDLFVTKCTISITQFSYGLFIYTQQPIAKYKSDDDNNE